MNSIIRKNDGLANALAKYRKGNFFILVALAAMMVLSAKSLRAATLYWDGNNATAGVGGSGSWANTQFSSSSSGGGTLVRATTADTVNFNAASGGASGNVITLASSSTWGSSGSTNIGTFAFNSDYILNVSGSSTTTINLNAITIAANTTFTLSNSPTLAFKANVAGTGATISGAGASSVLSMDQITTGSTDFKRVTLDNVTVTNLGIRLSGTGGGGYKGFVVSSGSSTIGANITNNTTDALVLGANSSTTLNVYGVVSGSGRVALSSGPSGGGGTVNLYSSSVNSGATEVNMTSGGTIRAQIDNAISTNSTLLHGFNAAGGGGIIDLNGFNQSLIGVSAATNASGRITNSAAGLSTLTINQATNSSYGLAIGGNMNLTKTNSGNFTLTASNSYSGGTTVSGGTLTASNNSALGTGSVTVGAGGTLSVLANLTNTVANSGTVSVGGGGTLTAASLGSGALSLAGSASTNRASFVSTQSDSALSIGNLTLGGYSTYSMDSSKTVSAGVITLAGTNNVINLTGSGLGVGTYNLFTGSSLSSGSLATGGLTLGGTGVASQTIALNGSQVTVGRTTYDFTSTSTALQLAVGGGAWNVLWNGGDGNWNTTSDAWQKNSTGANVAFFDGDNATISSGNTVTVTNAGVLAGTVAVNNASGTAVLAGGSLGASTFTKSGAGTLTVSNAVNVASGLNVNGGTANLNGGGTVTSGGLNVAGGTAVLNAAQTISAGGLNISSGSLTVNSTNTIAGGLNVNGGTATINSSSNSITGGVNANGGVLVVNANGALGNNAIAMNGGSLGVGTLGTVTNAVTVGAAGGTVTNDSALTLSGAITGAANTLTKKGSADLNLAGAFGASNSATGLNLQEGTVTLSGSSIKYLGNSSLNGNLIASNATLFSQGATYGGSGQVQIVGNTLWRANSSSSWITNNVALQSGSTLSFSNSVNLNLLGGLTGSGNVVLSQGGGGGIYISGNTFNGTITNNTSNDLRFYNADVSGITLYGGTGTGVLMFSNSTADRTVGGKISGAVALQVRGTSTTTFTNTTSDFTNTININGSVSGTTAKFVGNSMGAAAATAEISLGNSNTLSLDGATSQRSLGVKSGGGTVFVAGDSSLGAWTNNTSGASTNGMTLTKSGSGNLTFTGLIRDGTSADAPVLNLTAGTVTLGASSSTSQYIGINTNSSSYYVGDLAFLAGNQVGMHGSGTMGGGGKILFQGNDAALQTSSSSLNDGANLTIANDIVMNGGAGTKASLAATTSNSLTLNRVLGSGDLYFGTQSGGGGGLTSLNGPLSFTGNIYMNLSTNGVLKMSAANLVANNQGIVMYRSNSSASTTASGTVDLNGNNQTVGFLQSLSNNAAYMGVITSATAATLTLNQSSDTTYGGTLEGALSLVKNGAGIVTLANTNTMSGGVTINGGGIYLTNGSKGLGTGTLTMNGGRLAALVSGYVVTNAVVIAGDSTFGKTDGNGNSLTLSGGLDLGGGTRVVNLDNSIVSSGGISNGGLIIDSTLNRNFTVSGASSYTGGTTVRGGNLKLSGAGSLNSSGALDLAATTAAASLDISGLTGSGTTIGSLAGGANSTVALGTKNLNVGGNNSASTYAGAISGTGGSLTKSGSGKFTLTGSNAYTGATTVNAGTLEVASGASIGSSATTVNSATLTVNGTAGDVTVNSGGTVKGSGTLSALSIASGGTLAVGNSPGTMTASSATWNGGGTYAWEINNFLGSAGSAYDFLNVTGNLSINASSGNKFIIDVISLLASNNTAGEASNFDAYTNYSFAIATAAGGISGFSADYFDIQTGKFANSMLPSGAAGSGSWYITQSGNSINLNYAAAIPEPSTSGLFLIGLGVVTALRRRKVS